jgi:hypothetical protein
MVLVSKIFNGIKGNIMNLPSHCDKCHSKIKNGWCNCGQWITNVERSPFIKILEQCLYGYDHICEQHGDEKPISGSHHSGNCLRSAIVWLGEADPCSSRKEIENADPVRIQLGNLLASWYEIFGDLGMKTKDVVKRASEQKDEIQESLYDALLEFAPDGRGGINGRSLGKKLAQFKGRIESGYRLEQLPPNQGVAMWRVKKI